MDLNKYIYLKRNISDRMWEITFIAIIFSQEKEKKSKIDIKIVYFGLIFQAMNIAKTHQIASIFFKKNVSGRHLGHPTLCWQP